MNSNLSQEERARQDRLKEMRMQADMYNSQLGMIEGAQQSQYLGRHNHPSQPVRIKHGFSPKR